MKILYISDGFTGLSVFRSQVHTLCDRHGRKHDVHLGVFARLPEFGDSAEEGVSYTWSKSLLLPKSYIPTMNWLSCFFSNLGEQVRSADILHCRGHVGTAIGLRLRARYNPEVPLVADIRGVIHHELKESPSLLSRALSGRVLGLEKVVFNGPDWFFFVSDSLRDHFSECYGLDAGRTSVFPTIVDDESFFEDAGIRAVVRRQLGWEDRFIYVYAGGVDHWQNLDRILSRFHGVSAGRTDLALLLLVTDPDAIMQRVRELGLTENLVRVMRVPYEAVGRYLNGADAGLLIRDDSLVNRVASPTKAGEYRACGLRIITDLDDIGDINAPGDTSREHLPIEEILLGQEQVFQTLVTAARNRKTRA